MDLGCFHHLWFRTMFWGTSDVCRVHSGLAARVEVKASMFSSLGKSWLVFCYLESLGLFASISAHRQTIEIKSETNKPGQSQLPDDWLASQTCPDMPFSSRWWVTAPGTMTLCNEWNSQKELDSYCLPHSKAINQLKANGSLSFCWSLGQTYQYRHINQYNKIKHNHLECLQLIIHPEGRIWMMCLSQADSEVADKAWVLQRGSINWACWGPVWRIG